jgi:SAM-dependent methyltransferase
MRAFSQYDSRKYETANVIEGYGEWSKTYDGKMIDRLDRPLLEAMRFDWSNKIVLDQACGTGRVGLWLASKGVAAMDGVDLTDAMLERARTKGIYRHLAIADVLATGLADHSYDAVVQVLACEHLEAIGPLYAEVKRLAKPGGAFVLIGYHPFMMLRGIPTHFTRLDGRVLAIEQYLHLASDHVNTGVAHGFALQQMEENFVDDAWVASHPKYAKYLGHPISFALRWSST